MSRSALSMELCFFSGVPGIRASVFTTFALNRHSFISYHRHPLGLIRTCSPFNSANHSSLGSCSPGSRLLDPHLWRDKTCRHFLPGLVHIPALVCFLFFLFHIFLYILAFISFQLLLALHGRPGFGHASFSVLASNSSHPGEEIILVSSGRYYQHISLFYRPGRIPLGLWGSSLFSTFIFYSRPR
ncbi:hypothetical protein VTK56DRAFT_7847 [Thermocarpiscus australiensis]